MDSDCPSSEALNRFSPSSIREGDAPLLAHSVTRVKKKEVIHSLPRFPSRAHSGDASLAVFDLRQKKLEGRVSNQEDELLSVQILKVKKKTKKME